MMFIYSFFRLGFEIFQLLFAMHSLILRCKSRKNVYAIFLAIKQADYIWDLTNWIEVILFGILSIILFGAVLTKKNEGFCLLSWQWEMGAVIVLFSWIELIFLSTQFTIIGVHALMFKKILITLFKFIPFASFLITGFGLAFFFLLVQPHLMVSVLLHFIAIDINGYSYRHLLIPMEVIHC